MTSGADMFRCVAHANEQLLELHFRLRDRVEVSDVQHGCDIRYHPSQVTFFGYVEIKTKINTVLAWTLDIWLQDGEWTVLRHVVDQTEEDEKKLVDLPDSKFQTDQELLVMLPRLVHELCSSVDSFPLIPPTR